MSFYGIIEFNLIREDRKEREERVGEFVTMLLISESLLFSSERCAANGFLQGASKTIVSKTID